MLTTVNDINSNILATDYAGGGPGNNQAGIDSSRMRPNSHRIFLHYHRVTELHTYVYFRLLNW